MKTKHLEDERKHHQRPFISIFLDAALVGERTMGMEVATLQHGGSVAEDEVDSTLSYMPSRKGHAKGGVELFKLDCWDDLWVSLYCSHGLWFSLGPQVCLLWWRNYLR